MHACMAACLPLLPHALVRLHPPARAHAHATRICSAHMQRSHPCPAFQGHQRSWQEGCRTLYEDVLQLPWHANGIPGSRLTSPRTIPQLPPASCQEAAASLLSLYMLTREWRNEEVRALQHHRGPEMLFGTGCVMAAVGGLSFLIPSGFDSVNSNGYRAFHKMVGLTPFTRGVERVVGGSGEGCGGIWRGLRG